jgi:beta-phosphoglucomutase-like phosphatase (HAD superfamily)
MKTLTGIKDDQEIRKIISLKDKLFNESYKFTLFKGAEDLLNHIQKTKIIPGLVTASSKDRYEKSCPKWFQNYFSITVTSEDGGRGKPYPDPYNNAASKASVIPKNVLVLENSPYGICSANEAGMDTVGVAHTVSIKKLDHAKYVYKNINEFYKEMINEN